MPDFASRSLLVRALLATVLAVTAGCVRVPRAGPMTGIPVNSAVPRTALPPERERLIFRWEYHERVGSARGDGAARIAPPDSVRLDFFLDNGTSGGCVTLIADSLRLGAQQDAARYLPPPAMLWAALGRVTVTGPDTVVYQDGDTLRAQLGGDPGWRLAFAGDGLRRLERVARGRIAEAVERIDSTRVVFRQYRSARSMTLVITRRVPETGFNETIWRC